MNIRKINWPVWAGFLLTVIAFLSYFFVFASFAVTRDFPLVNLLLFAVALVLLLFGLRRAFAADRPRRSKIAASILVTLSVAILGSFIFVTFIGARRLPASHGAPQVGQKAPDFTLTDANGKAVSLSELLSSSVGGKPTKGVLLIFYRGYW